MNLDQEILNVLIEAGTKGLKIEKIARHVYNSCNSIFNPLTYDHVHAYVTQYLIKCAKNPSSIIERGKGVGVYHINYQSDAIQQLMLNFGNTNGQNQKEIEDKGKDIKNVSPSLFDNL